jgi:hypothetical protein
VWIGTIVASLVVLGGIELVGRARGFTPSYQETPRLWALWRRTLSSDDPRAVALLGTSRTQLGIVPDILEREWPGHSVAMLAVPGASAVTQLEDLAVDPHFRGLALFEIYPSALFSDEPARERRTAAFAAYARTTSFIEPAEAYLRLFFQGTLVLGRAEFRPTNLVPYVTRDKKLPDPDYIVLERSRYARADYSRVDLSKKPPWTFDPGLILPPAARDARARHIRRLADRIRARGGDVVFYRSISTGAPRELERRHLPREEFDDRFAAALDGYLFIHFEDHAGLREYDCPDGTHLDSRQAGPHTVALARLLKSRGVVPRPASGR